MRSALGMNLPYSQPYANSVNDGDWKEEGASYQESPFILLKTDGDVRQPCCNACDEDQNIYLPFSALRNPELNHFAFLSGKAGTGLW